MGFMQNIFKQIGFQMRVLKQTTNVISLEIAFCCIFHNEIFAYIYRQNYKKNFEYNQKRGAK